MQASVTDVSVRGFRGCRKFAAILMAGLFAVLTLGAPDAGAVNCPTSPEKVIPFCCTIAHHGGFLLQPGVKSASGTCVKVTVPNVAIDMGGNTITNSGTALTGTAIRVFSTAPNTIIIGNFPTFTSAGPIISNFNIAIQSDATNVGIIDVQTDANNKGIVINGRSNGVLLVSADSNQKNGIQLNLNPPLGQNATGDAIIMSDADSNGGSGVLLNGASSTFIYNVDASDNGKFGFWLNGASSNNLLRFTADTNLGGVMLGCHASGLTGVPCAVAAKGNTLVGDVISSPTTNSKVDSNSSFGVGIEIGSKNNHVVGVEGSGNPVNKDAVDNNLACGTDLWLGNAFTGTTPSGASPVCIN